MKLLLFLLSVVSSTNINFKYVGQLYSTPTIFHASFAIDLKPFQKACQEFALITDGGILALVNREDLNIAKWNHHHACQELLSFHSILRSKRSILSTILTSIAGLFGIDTLIHLFTKNKDDQLIGHLVHQVQDTEWNIHNIITKVNKVSERLKNLNSEVQDNKNILAHMNFVHTVQSETEKFLQQVQELINAVPVLYLNKIPPTLITNSDIFSLFQILQQKANKLGIFLPENFLHTVYALPVSTLLKDDQLLIVLHIPTFSSPPLDLFSMQNFPFPIFLNNTIAFIQLDEFYNFIAKENNSTQFVPLNQNSLQSCFTLQHQHFCPNLVLHYLPSPICIANLIHNNSENFHTFCNYHYVNQNFSVTPTSAGWKIATRSQIDIHIQCPNVAPLKTTTINISTFDIAPNCKLYSNLFFINGKTFNFNVKDISVKMNITLVKDSRARTREFTNLSKHFAPMMHAEDSDLIVETHTHDNLAVHTTVNTSLISVIALTLCILILSILFCMFNKSKNP